MQRKKFIQMVGAGTAARLGWGHNQLWLQSAIGSWGESITFEPDQTHGKGLVLDSRPLAVWGIGSKPGIKWSWTIPPACMVRTITYGASTVLKLSSKKISASRDW